MSLDILVVGDLHCRPRFLKDFEKVKEDILKAVDDHKPNFVILLGDSLHTHAQVHTEALNSVHDLVKKLSKKAIVYMLVGNHDYVSNSEFCTENHPFNSFKSLDNVRVVDKPCIYTSLEKITMVFCPYVPVGRFSEMIDPIVQNNSVDLIFAHQEFKGSKFGAVHSENGDVWDHRLPHIISGHIHEYQVLKNIMYVGTPYMTTFGESEDKGIFLFRLNKTDKLSLDIKKIVLDVPRKLTTVTDLDNLEAIKEGLNQTDHHRLIVRDTSSRLFTLKKTEIYQNLIKKDVKVVLEPTDTVVVDQNKRSDTYLNILTKAVEGDAVLAPLLKEIINV